MVEKSDEKNRKSAHLALLAMVFTASLTFSGCLNGYSNESLFPDNVESVRVEMFDNQTFRRGTEYTLTDALAKRIEAQTPYKIISSKDRADTVISGYLVVIDEALLTMERDTGAPLEKEVELAAVVNWKDLKTGKMLIDNVTVRAWASYSPFQNQNFEYASSLAANNLAIKIVELMEKKW